MIISVLLDIQLNVKGVHNLADSLKEYLAIETMEGDNQYRAEGFGLQDARKGVVFESFPPILHLQLQRFEFNYDREQHTKVRHFLSSDCWSC